MRYVRVAVTSALLVAVALLVGRSHESTTTTTIIALPAYGDSAFDPKWSGVYAHLYPDFRGISTVSASLETSIHSLITVSPDGRLRRVPFTESTVRRITRTFEDDVSGNEEHTIGACTKAARR